MHSGPPSSVLLQVQQLALTTNESTSIECSVVGGGPRESFNLTLWRNTQLVDKVTGDYLSYVTRFHPYGTYTCAVGGIANSSMLQERGS